MPLALTALAAHGARLGMVAQEPEELARVYGREALATIMSQSDTKLFFGINAPGTAQMVSRMLGQQTVLAESFGLGTAVADGASLNLSRSARALMSEDELRRLPDDEAILITGNLRPARLLKAGFHEIEPMRSKIAPSPFFGGKRFLGRVKLRLRGNRAIVTRAGRRQEARARQPLLRPLLAYARFLPPGTGALPLAALMAIVMIYGQPHLRITYSFSGPYSDKTIHACRFAGLPVVGHSFMRTGHENCPLVTWIRLGERP